MVFELADSLGRALSGDAHAIGEISIADHYSLRAAGETLGEPLTVTRTAAASVLQDLIDGRLSPPAAQAWASFMRRGYVADGGGGPIRPIEIEFEHAWEDAISETSSGLDEIGDAIDGEVTAAEGRDLLRLLGVRGGRSDGSTSRWIIDELLDTGLDDWVSLHDVVALCSRGAIDQKGRRAVLDVLESLYSDGLMVPGDLEGGFEDWAPPSEGWVARSEAELDRLDWRPMGAGFWLRLTGKGEQLARRQKAGSAREQSDE